MGQVRTDRGLNVELYCCSLGPQEATTMYGEEVMMRFIAADQTEEEDEQMNKFKRQFEYFNFFQGFSQRSGDRPAAAQMVNKTLHYGIDISHYFSFHSRRYLLRLCGFSRL